MADCAAVTTSVKLPPKLSLTELSVGWFGLGWVGNGSDLFDFDRDVSQPDSDWSFLAVSSPIERLPGVITEHQAPLLTDNADKLIFMLTLSECGTANCKHLTRLVLNW